MVVDASAQQRPPRPNLADGNREGATLPRPYSSQMSRAWPAFVGQAPTAPIKKKKLASSLKRASRKIPGSDLLSHAPTHAVPSAEAGLTSVFGMGTGGTLPL